ncbi:VOC family protein [Luedemannella flava]
MDEPRPATATVEPVDEPLPRRVPRQRDESQFPSAEVIVGEVLNQRTAVGQTVHGVGTKLYVADIDRSRRFYREVMGFTEVAAAGGRAEFSFPGGRVLLSRVAENPVPARNLRRLLLDVTDIAAVYHDLEREGVACRSRPHRSGGDGRSEIWVATLEDPDGNIIELNEPIAFGSRTRSRAVANKGRYPVRHRHTPAPISAGPTAAPTTDNPTKPKITPSTPSDA